MRKTRVLFFYPNEFLGPEMTVYTQIIRHLDRSRFIPYLILNADATGTLALSEMDGVIIRRWKFGESVRNMSPGRLRSSLALPSSAYRMARYARRERIDVVHCASLPRTSLVGILLARHVGAGLLVHYHVLPGRFRGARGMIEHATARFAGRSVAVSEFIAEHVKGIGAPADKVDVIPNGVDLDRFHPCVDGSEMRREYGIAAGTPLVLQLGRIHQGKRQEDLVRALAIARRRVPELRCLVVGWEDDRYSGSFPSYRAELEHIAEQANLADALILGPARTEAAQLMAAADIVAVPSVNEAFCLVVAEAMATGRPVAAARSGAIPELVEDGVTGFLVPPRSPEALAERLVALAADSCLRDRMGAAGRRRAETHFNETRLASQFAPIYESLKPAAPRR